MKKLKINFFLLLILFFFTTEVYSFNLNFKNKYLFKYSSDENIINISEKNLDRLRTFFLGNFFSYEQNNFQTSAYGVYFALSKSGNSSVMSFCNEKIDNCILNNMQFITKKKCERLSAEKCFIIATNNKIILNKKIFNTNKNSFEQLLPSLFKIHENQNKKQVVSDIRTVLYRDFDSKADWE